MWYKLTFPINIINHQNADTNYVFSNNLLIVIYFNVSLFETQQ